MNTSNGEHPVTYVPQVELLGIRVAKVNYAQTITWIDEMVTTKQRGYICVAAVHTVMACRDDQELYAAVQGASFTVADGQPVVWALNALGHQLAKRVYGPELMARYCAHAAKQGTKLYLYGGRDEGALATLRTKLTERFPELQIVGSYSPPHRPLTAAEHIQVVTDINHSEAEVVWVGIGVPKQEKWMAQFRTELAAPVLVGVGAAFDFHANLIPQAPPWMQRAGLEWLFRLYQEPRRLWKRYLYYNPRFIFAVTRAIIQQCKEGK